MAYVPLSFSLNLQAEHRADVCTQAVRQTVRIVSIDHPQNLLRTGDRASVLFEFIAHPEFVKAGMKLLFREGKTKVKRPEAIFCVYHVIDGSCRVLVLSRRFYEPVGFALIL